MLRRLLNVASIVCLVACVALMGTWVRSYYWIDEFTSCSIASYEVGGGSGISRLAVGAMIAPRAEGARSRHQVVTTRASELANIEQRWATFAGFGISKAAPVPAGFCSVMVPYWFAIAVTGALCFAPWSRVKYRFGLRSLFVMTTVLAVGLGLIVWLKPGWIGK